MNEKYIRLVLPNFETNEIFLGDEKFSKSFFGTSHIRSNRKLHKSSQELFELLDQTCPNKFINQN